MLSTYSILLRSTGPRLHTPFGVSSLLCTQPRYHKNRAPAPACEPVIQVSFSRAGRLQLLSNKFRPAGLATFASLHSQAPPSSSRKRSVWASRPWRMQQQYSTQQQHQHPNEPANTQQRSNLGRPAATSQVQFACSQGVAYITASITAFSRLTFPSAGCSIIANHSHGRSSLYNSCSHGM